MNRTHLFALIILTIGFGVGWWVTRDNIQFSIQQASDKPKPARQIPIVDNTPGRTENLGKRILTESKDTLEDLMSVKNERIVRFPSEDAYRRALSRLGDFDLKLLGQMDRFRSLRIGLDDLNNLKDWLGDDGEGFSNYIVAPPLVPDPDAESAGGVGFGARALALLGVRSDNSAWGDGVKVAVIDTGVQNHLALSEANIRQIRLPDAPEISEPHGHGTAVASIIAGQHNTLTGVAPSSEILAIQVANAEGSSNSFLLAEGIVAAVDHGADIINISMGSYGDSFLVREAIAYAQESGAAIVASAGNESLDFAAYPAAYEGVISVGAIDAVNQHMDFSNESADLSLSAPGLGVLAAWTDDNAIEFSGTSASAPFVSGTLAAIISESDGAVSGTQAVDILLSHTNEAGAPGADTQYGNGTLDIGRIIQRETDGISDLAVASHYYNFENSSLQISLENRGTEHIFGGQLTVKADGAEYPVNLGGFAPNERQVVTLPVGANQLQTTGEFPVTSEASFTSNTNDAFPANNQLIDLITAPSTSENGP